MLEFPLDQRLGSLRTNDEKQFMDNIGIAKMNDLDLKSTRCPTLFRSF